EVMRLDDGTRAGTLRDAALRYPHGLCFDADGRRLYVADAGERDLHAFDRPDGAWDRSSAASTFAVPAVDPEALRRTKDAAGEGRYRRLEGGVKGIDVDRTGRVVVTTCRHQTLRFFEPAAAGVGRAAS